MKFKQIISASLALFLFGCGSSDGENTIPTTPGELPSPSLEPYFYQQWYLARDASFYTAQAIEQNASINPATLLDKYSGKGVKIAVIDDGLDTSHPDLYKAVVASFDISTKTTDVTHKNGVDFHGTAVTGIIGARSNYKGIRGVASRADIIFLKYKDSMTDAETIELFNKAEAFGADIINCSWGTYAVSDAVRDKIVDLSKNERGGKGTLIVFAAGNDDYNLDDPAYNDESEISEVISVGATDKVNLRAGYSNYGSALDVMAPGGGQYDNVSLTTLDDTGYKGATSGDYILYNAQNGFIGTSAAAPVVSGVLGLLLEKDANLTHDAIVNLLKTKSDKIGAYSYDANGWNKYYGYGKINLSRLME